MKFIKYCLNNVFPVGNTFSAFKYYYYFIRENLLRYLITFLLAGSISLLGAVLIWFVGRGFDALSSNDLHSMRYFILFFISFVLVLQFFRYLMFYQVEWLQQKIIYSSRRELYSHLLLLATPFKDSHATGDLLTRLGHDTIRVSELLVLTPTQLFSYAFTFFLYLGVLFYIDVWLTVLIIAIIPLLLVHQYLYIKKTKISARHFLTEQGNMGAFEEESLTNLQGIITFSAETNMLSRFDKQFSLFRKAAMRNLMLNNGFVVSFELLIALGAIMLVMAGVYKINQQVISLGDLINFLLYLGYLSIPLRGLANVPIEVQIRTTAAERVKEILDTPATIKDKEDSIEITQVTGGIKFKNVTFSYPDKEATINAANLTIHPGEVLAIMGPSGIGKTTLAKLLLRIYDPDCGCICIDDNNIRSIKLSSLRSHIAVVWQDPFILDETIFDNMRLCNPQATEEQISKALKSAYAFDFIDNLPQGFKTKLGSHGVRLSTGQRQRIAIAQALLQQARILILDEATSALDSESEQLIHNAIEDLRGQCTIIVIAHRISTIMNADRVVYMNADGTLTVGSHTELKNHHEAFKRVVEYQSQ